MDYKLDEMNLEQVETRIAELDGLVETRTETADIDKDIEEKKSLLERKAELEKLEQRKQTAKELTSGKVAEYRTIEIMKGKDNMDIFKGMNASEVRGTEEYRSAFYKSLLGRQLSEVEQRANEMGTTDVAGVIPTQSSNTIFDLVRKYAPLLSEVTLLNVPGPVKFGIENTNNAAAIHTQNAAITPSADDMTYVQLNGFEITKALRISKTVAAQAISAFETWLTDYLARGIAAKVGALMIYGSGSSQPKGIDYMNTWTDTTNAVQWASTAPTAAELLELVSYLKAGYHNGAKFLMNASTLWGKIAPQQDNSKFKILNDDYTRILGYPVLLDDNVAAGDIFFGNWRQGMVANFSQAITVQRSSESGFLYNAYDFLGSTIFDCTTTHTEGFVKSAAALTAGA